MFGWLKEHKTIIVSVVITTGFILYAYGCESKVLSLNHTAKKVTRQELQIELNSLLDLAEVRFLDLESQDQLKALILQNAIILVQGQPFNPVGILTGFAAIYGIGQAGNSVSQTVNNIRKKRKVNNE